MVDATSFFGEEEGTPSSYESEENNGIRGLPEHLKMLKHLGSGSYGDVYLCQDTRSGNRVAVKHVKDAPSQGKVALREIRFLARLRHPNLLHLLDLCAVPSKKFRDMFLVLPYLPTDLDLVIHESTWPLSDKKARVIVSQILQACGHLHAAGVAHRDLKPANVLISHDFKVKVCDFGLARCGVDFNTEVDKSETTPRHGGGGHPGHLTEHVVTREYRAPEVMLLPKHYTSAIDIWSIGCILGELLLRKVMFEGKGPVELICRMAEVLGTPTENDLEWLPKDSDAYRFVKLACPLVKGRSLAILFDGKPSASVDLMRRLLSWDPRQRLTAAQAQKHEYIRHHQPKTPPTPPEPFDWSFDDYQPTYEDIRERLYMECASHHPEILKRDCVSKKAQAVQPKRQRRTAALPAMATPRLFKRAACTFAAFLA
jgi:serine/threonine protein kinase